MVSVYLNKSSQGPGIFGGNIDSSNMERIFNPMYHGSTMAIGVLALNYWRARNRPVERKKEA
jgi:hypothetical protein